MRSRVDVADAVADVVDAPDDAAFRFADVREIRTIVPTAVIPNRRAMFLLVKRYQSVYQFS